MLDQWLKNIKAHPELGVGGNKPAGASDSCFNADGSLLATGPNVWNGILDSGPKGACAQAFPPFGTSRIVAGGPIEGGIFKCHLQPVEEGARTRPVRVVDADRRRGRPPEAIFPTGVCDYSKGDAGEPNGLDRKSK